MTRCVVTAAMVVWFAFFIITRAYALSGCTTYAYYLQVHKGQTIPRVAQILSQPGVVVWRFRGASGLRYQYRRYRTCSNTHHILVGFGDPPPGTAPLLEKNKAWI